MDKNSKQIHKNRLDWEKANKMRIMILYLIFAMSTYCSKSKEESFIKTYGGNGPDRGVHIIQTIDGNFVIVGNTMTEANKLDVYLIKCNSSGDTLWTRTFGGQEDDNGWCVKETSDKGYIITGFTESYNASMNDVLLLKTDENGKKQWHKTYGGSGDDIAWSIAISQDDGYTIAAQTNSFGNGELDAYLIRTDENGDTLWTKTFGGPNVDRVFSVDLANDGSILLAGITYSYGAGDRDAYLLKTDPNGELLWQNTYGGPGYDNAHTVIVNRENDIILTGYGDYWSDAGKMDMFLKQISLKGEDIWTQTYGGTENDRAMTVFQLQDGGYILTGFTQSYGAGDWDAYVVKTGSKGDTLWTSTHGTPAPDFGYDIIQSRKGDYFVTGWSHGLGHPEGDLLLIKTNH
jgi:hypothetical protein